MLEAIDPSTWVLVIAIGLLIAMLTTSRKPPNLPPGPWALPIVGHYFTFRRSPILHKTITKLSDGYGPVVTFQVGDYWTFALNGYDIMREALIDKAEYFSERPGWLRTVKDLHRERGIFQSHDWKARRRFALSSMRDFGLGKKSLEQRIQEEAGFLVQELEKWNGKALDVTQILPYTTANIICSVIVNDRFNYDDGKLRQILDALSVLVGSSNRFNSKNFFTFAKYVSDPVYNDLKQSFEVLNNMAKGWRIEHEKDFDSENLRDLVDLFIAERKKEDNDFGELDTVATIVDLFIAGTETTSTTLAWALLYLIHRPDIQQKCREEIHQEVGIHALPWYKDMAGLPYTNAVINEVQRIGNILPFSIWHAASEDVELAGYTIPKGSIVMLNLETALRDKKYWSEPDRFDPGRWLGKDGKIIKNPAFIPFSIGKRVCLGEQLARRELFMFFTAMIQNFEFKMEDEKHPPSLKGNDGAVHAPLPFKVIPIKL